MTNLIAPDGRTWRATTAAETTRLKAKGYREDSVENHPIPAAPFNPSDHTVVEVQEYINTHPEQAEAVLDLERNGQARKTLLGEDA